MPSNPRGTPLTTYQAISSPGTWGAASCTSASSATRRPPTARHWWYITSAPVHARKTSCSATPSSGSTGCRPPAAPRALRIGLEPPKAEAGAPRVESGVGSSCDTDGALRRFRVGLPPENGLQVQDRQPARPARRSSQLSTPVLWRLQIQPARARAALEHEQTAVAVPGLLHDSRRRVALGRCLGGSAHSRQCLLGHA